MRRPSCQSIANELGVSVWTVYRVINNTATVSARLRNRVIKALNRNGYFNQKTAPVQRIVFNLNGNSFATRVVILPVMQKLSQGAFNCVVTDFAADPRRFEDAVAEASVVVWGCDVNDEIIARAKKFNPDATHITVLNCGGGDIAIDTDNIQSGRLAAEHLHRNGHRTIILCCNLSGVRTHFNRAVSFEAEMHRLNPDCEVRRLSGSEAEITEKLPLLLDGATAIFCSAGMYGKIVCEQILRLGKRIPEDFSVVTHDLAAYSDSEYPLPLDTLHTNFDTMIQYLEYFIVNRPLMTATEPLHALITPCFQINHSVRPAESQSINHKENILC